MRLKDGLTDRWRYAFLFEVTFFERRAETKYQFHFASILSPWTRRSLIAAGFGIGSPEFSVRHEIAPVTRYHDQFISDPEHSDEQCEEPVMSKLADPETTVVVTTRSASSASFTYEGELEGGSGTLVPSTTPFFHFDVAAAVRAAEHGVGQRERK